MTNTPETAPVAATRADRERLAAYYRHPLVANPSRAEAVLADDWLSGASYAEIAMLETLARHRTANETAPPARSVRTRPKEVSMTVSKPETVEVTRKLKPQYPDYLDDPEGLERFRQAVIDNHGHEMAAVNHNSLGRLVDTIDKLRHRLNATPSRQDGLREAATEALKCLRLSVQSFPDVERKLRSALSAFNNGGK